MPDSGEEGFFGLIKKVLKIERAKDAGFSEKDALAQFQMVATAGPTGQVPATEYGAGNTVIMNRFPPGTILRERCINLDKSDDQYFWWCVGQADKKTGKMGFYMAEGSQAFEEFLGGELKVVDKGMQSTSNNKNVEFEVGPWGTVIDLWMHQNIDSFPADLQENMLKMKDTRRTVRIDLMKWGTPVKEERKENVPGVVLQPVAETIGARNR
jgi:hypothetical protein